MKLGPGYEPSKQQMDLVIGLGLDRAVAAVDGVAKQVAKEAVARIKNDIRRGKLGSSKNDKAYAAWKRAQGYSARPLVQTGQYLSSITTKKIAPGAYLVTVKDGRHHSGLTFAQLGMIHEYGVRGHLPPRPHFRPAHAWAVQEMRRRLRP